MDLRAGLSLSEAKAIHAEQVCRRLRWSNGLSRFRLQVEDHIWEYFPVSNHPSKPAGCTAGKEMERNLTPCCAYFLFSLPVFYLNVRSRNCHCRPPPQVFAIPHHCILLQVSQPVYTPYAAQMKIHPELPLQGPRWRFLLIFPLHHPDILKQITWLATCIWLGIVNPHTSPPFHL